MAYKEELQSNNTELQAVLDAVNTLPDASAGSVSSLDTCTLVINIGFKAYIAYTTVDENGNVCSCYELLSASEHTMTAVCGSVVSFMRYSTSLTSLGLSKNNADYGYLGSDMLSVHITAGAGETASIYMISGSEPI